MTCKQVAVLNEEPRYSIIIEKKTAKKTLPLSDFWCTLQVHCIVIFVATKLCYYQLLDFRQGVRENLMKGQGVRVHIKVKNHCNMHIVLHALPLIYVSLN